MCRDYRCAWIDGAGRAADRPNECGVLIDTRETSGGPVLVARDLGGSTGRKRKAIDRIAEDLDMPCLLVADDDPERVLFVRGPRRAVAALVARRPEMAGLV